MEACLSQQGTHGWLHVFLLNLSYIQAVIPFLATWRWRTRSASGSDW